MSLLASFGVRCLCVVLPGSLVLLLCASRCHAWEAILPGETPLLFTWGHEISVTITLAWSVLVAACMFRNWRVPLAESFGTALRSSMMQHVILSCLAALMLDGGLAILSYLLAAALFWMVVGLVVSRRPSSPSEADIIVVKHGFWILFAVVTGIAYHVQTLASAGCRQP